MRAAYIRYVIGYLWRTIEDSFHSIRLALTIDSLFRKFTHTAKGVRLRIILRVVPNE
jgi:hypothetical protein